MNDWTFKLLYDGECPICRAEVRWLSRWNKKQRLAFEDIKGEGFDPAVHGKTLDELMGALHGVFPDGRLVTGAETFREAYKALGLGWVMAPTGWPLLKPLADLAYAVFARHRLKLGRWFGGPGEGCEQGSCRISTHSDKH